MKCPEQYRIIQNNIRRTVNNEDGIVVRENHLLIEYQNLGECYKEECAAWDKEKNRCRKVGE